MKTFYYPFICIESPIKSTDIDFSLYTTKTLTPDFKIHWRILKEQKEIEMVLVVNGTSWVGFGWRPKKLTAECRKFPEIHDVTQNIETAVEPSPEVSAEPSAESSAEPSAEVSAEPSPESSAEPAPEVAAEPSPETSAEPKSEPSAEVAAEPASEPSNNNKKSDPLALGSSKSKRVAAPQSKSSSNSEILPKIPSSKDEYTVSTSVSYRVSSVTGRRKRAVEKGLKRFYF